jgi:superfamily II DNA/RNA helicase
LGVTATPLSSNIKEPMYKNYNTLITGSSIHELIQNNYLSRPNYTHYNIGLGMLKVGANGDYTVKSSDELYASEDMLNKTLKAYYETSFNKKTLIFNNGIKTSLEVYETLKKANLPVKHLDHSFTSEERKDILKWFKHTPNAIISSVSILTTGFDEPTIESIILNRATRSIALYFQMIGRGSRLLPNKNNFQITDLGNNIVRFGFWHDPVDWHYIFKYPEYFIQNIKNDKEIEEQFSYEMTQETKSFFPNTTNFEFNIVKEYQQALKKFLKAKTVIDKSVDQHVDIIFENADNFQTARKLIEILKDEIEFRVRQYTHQLGNTTFNYRNWLIEDYHLKLRQKLNAKYRELALKE